ncbi:HNH endonuclease [Prosthecobacter sp.]|uniref:HNH endonuclease n=1 Tax=Prosthecobacter sp. TaxID=1965333 RepID=UPI003784BE5F
MTTDERRQVRLRANERCEYCQMRQQDEAWSRFHVEHIIPRKHKGGDDLGNLGLCCQHCNLHKGSNLSGFDPSTGLMTRLFHPREDVWGEHFSVVGLEILGCTAIGRTTVEVLDMNSVKRMSFRQALREAGDLK